MQNLWCLQLYYTGFLDKDLDGLKNVGDVLKTVGVSNSSIAGVSNSSIAGVSNSSIAGVSNSSIAGVSNSSIAGVSNSSIAGVSKRSIAGVSNNSGCGYYFTFYCQARYKLQTLLYKIR